MKRDRIMGAWPLDGSGRDTSPTPTPLAVPAAVSFPSGGPCGYAKGAYTAGTDPMTASSPVLSALSASAHTLTMWVLAGLGSGPVAGRVLASFGGWSLVCSPTAVDLRCPDGAVLTGEPFDLLKQPEWYHLSVSADPVSGRLVYRSGPVFRKERSSAPWSSSGGALSLTPCMPSGMAVLSIGMLSAYAYTLSARGKSLHYRFDAGLSYAPDRSGHGRDSAPYGEAAPIADRVAVGVSRIPSSPSGLALPPLCLTRSGLTLSAWVRVEAAGDGRVFGWDEANLAVVAGQYAFVSGGRPYFAAPVRLGEWVHLMAAVRYTPSGATAICLADGVSMVGLETMDVPPAGGMMGGGALAKGFGGSVCDVRAYASRPRPDTDAMGGELFRSRLVLDRDGTLYAMGRFVEQPGAGVSLDASGNVRASSLSAVGEAVRVGSGGEIFFADVDETSL